MDDREIVGLFYERSEQAVAELDKKYGAICHAVAGNILNNRLDAEECVNDAYLGVWNTVPPQRPEALLSYVCRIVRNLSIKRYHANRAIKRNSIYDAALDELEEYIPHSPTAESECTARELAEAIDRFLETLDRENRVIFVRRYWYSDAISQIAERMGMKQHTVSVRLSRTRAKLKKFLKKEGIAV